MLSGILATRGLVTLPAFSTAWRQSDILNSVHHTIELTGASCFPNTLHWPEEKSHCLTRLSRPPENPVIGEVPKHIASTAAGCWKLDVRSALLTLNQSLDGPRVVVWACY
jgi:hypothetical protein